MSHYHKVLAGQLTHFQQLLVLKVLISLNMDNFKNYPSKNVLIVMTSHSDAMEDMLKIA
jgi:hypothetical protein